MTTAQNDSSVPVRIFKAKCIKKDDMRGIAKGVVYEIREYHSIALGCLVIRLGVYSLDKRMKRCKNLTCNIFGYSTFEKFMEEII